MPNLLAVVAVGPGELRMNTELPTPTPGEIELSLVSTQISPLDQQIVLGQFPLTKTWPVIPGTTAVGHDTNGLHFLAFAEIVGGGFKRDGVHASRFSLPHRVLFPLPEGCDYQQAAAAILSLATVRSIYSDIAIAQPGQKTLILGANGSIGRAAIFVGKKFGLDMIAASRTGLNIDGVAGVRNSEIQEKARGIWGAGSEIIIDPVGGEITDLAIAAANPDCKHVLLGFSAGAMMPLVAPRFLLGEHQITGFNLLRRSADQLTKHIHDAVQDVVNGFTCEIDSIYPLRNAQEAYARASLVRGRVLLSG
jgi:NADPH2:quinone reductase